MQGVFGVEYRGFHQKRNAAKAILVDRQFHLIVYWGYAAGNGGRCLDSSQRCSMEFTWMSTWGVSNKTHNRNVVYRPKCLVGTAPNTSQTVATAARVCLHCQRSPRRQLVRGHHWHQYSRRDVAASCICLPEPRERKESYMDIAAISAT